MRSNREDPDEGNDRANDFDPSWWNMAKGCLVGDDEEGTDKLENGRDGGVPVLDNHEVGELNWNQAKNSVGENHPSIMGTFENSKGVVALD